MIKYEYQDQGKKNLTNEVMTQKMPFCKPGVILSLMWQQED